MKSSYYSFSGRMLALGALLTATACSVSEQVKESPSKKSISRTASNEPAYEQVQYRLNFMDEAKLGDQDILFVRQATDLTSPQQAKLQTGLQSGKLPLHLRMRLFARNPSQENLQLKQLDYQLLLDGKPLTSGVTGANTELESSAIVTLPITVDVNVPRERTNGSTPAAFAANLADFTGSTRRLTLRIRPSYAGLAVPQSAEFKTVELVTVKQTVKK